MFDWRCSGVTGFTKLISVVGLILTSMFLSTTMAGPSSKDALANSYVYRYLEDPSPLLNELSDDH